MDNSKFVKQCYHTQPISKEGKKNGLINRKTLLVLKDFLILFAGKDLVLEIESKFKPKNMYMTYFSLQENVGK